MNVYHFLFAAIYLHTQELQHTNMEQNLSLSFIIQVHMLRREGYKQSTGMNMAAVNWRKEHASRKPACANTVMFFSRKHKLQLMGPTTD